MYKFLVFTLVLGCAQTADVFRQKDGSYKVTGVAADKAKAQEIARNSAKKHCEDKALETVILSEKDKYSGRYSEDTNKDIKTASKVGSIIFGDPSLIAAGDAARGEDNYSWDLNFKCAK